MDLEKARVEHNWGRMAVKGTGTIELQGLM